MNYLVVSKTHRGIARISNQDCLVVKHKEKDKKEVVFAVICDGVGGLAKGDFASQYITKEFDSWFDNTEFDSQNISLIGLKISAFLKELNNRLLEIGVRTKERMGTTFTCIFLVDDKYACVHIGDTRLYEIDNEVLQLTTDHVLTEKKNVLWQCIGVSEKIEPQIITGTFKGQYFLLCSDGFRHKLLNEDIIAFLKVNNLNTRKMNLLLNEMFDLIMKRKEKDNISAILIKKNYYKSRNRNLLGVLHEKVKLFIK